VSNTNDLRFSNYLDRFPGGAIALRTLRSRLRSQRDGAAKSAGSTSSGSVGRAPWARRSAAARYWLFFRIGDGTATVGSDYLGTAPIAKFSRQHRIPPVTIYRAAFEGGYWGGGGDRKTRLKPKWAARDGCGAKAGRIHRAERRRYPMRSPRRARKSCNENEARPGHSTYSRPMAVCRAHPCRL
jgi:hypothetical protein